MTLKHIVKIEKARRKKTADPDKFRAHQMRPLRKVIDGMYTMFIWDESVEGADFWVSVVDRLEQIRDNRGHL